MTEAELLKAIAEAAREGGKSLNLSQKSIKTILKALQDKNDGKI